MESSYDSEDDTSNFDTDESLKEDGHDDGDESNVKKKTAKDLIDENLKRQHSVLDISNVLQEKQGADDVV